MLKGSLRRNDNEMFRMLAWKHPANQYNTQEVPPGEGITWSEEIASETFLHFSAGILD